MSNPIFTDATLEGVHLEVTIAEDASLSESIDLKHYALIGVLMPSGWTDSLTFQVGFSINGTIQYFDVYDNDGNEIVAVGGSSRFVRIYPTELPAVKYLKVRTGTSGTPIAQGSNKTITLLIREV